MKEKKFEERMIPISKIKIMRHRDRDQDKFEEFVESIKLLQIKAVFVREDENGGYELFSGEGRINALKEIGKEQVRALVFPALEIDDKEIFMEWLAANARREAPPLDIAWLMLHEKTKGLSNEEIAAKYGKKPSTVRHQIRTVEKADKEVIDAIEEGALKFHQAQQIVGRIADKEGQQLVTRWIKTDKINPKFTAKVIDSYKEKIRNNSNRLPKLEELRKELKSMDSYKVDIDESLKNVLSRISYLENVTAIISDDVSFLALINEKKLTFSDLLDREV